MIKKEQTKSVDDKKKLQQSPIWLFSVSLLWGQHLGHLTNEIHDSPVAGPSSHTIQASHMLILGDGREWKVSIRSISEFWAFGNETLRGFSLVNSIPGCSEKTMFRHKKIRSVVGYPTICFPPLSNLPKTHQKWRAGKFPSHSSSDFPWPKRT